MQLQQAVGCLSILAALIYCTYAIFHVYVTFLAWFKYAAFVDYKMKRQAFLRKLGFGMLMGRQRSRRDWEKPLYKWYHRIFFLFFLLLLPLPIIGTILHWLGFLG